MGWIVPGARGRGRFGHTFMGRPDGEAITAQLDVDRAIEVRPVHRGTNVAQPRQQRGRRVAVVVVRAERDQGDGRPDRGQQRRRRRRGAAVVGDLEQVDPRQAPGHEHRIHVVLRVAREEESPAVRLAQQHDRRAVDRPAVRTRLRGHPGCRPERDEPDLANPEAGTGGECRPGRAAPQGGVPRGPARTRPTHPGLVDLPDPVPLEHPHQARHVVLVRMRQDHDVEPAVPRRHPRVQLEQQPLRVRSTVHEHPGPVPRLEEDRVALADVQHHDPGRAARDVADGDGRDGDDDDGDAERHPVAPRETRAVRGTGWGGRVRHARPPSPTATTDRPDRGRGERDHEHREEGDDGCQLDRDRDGGERQPGREAHDAHDHVEQEPARQPECRGHDRRQPQHGRGAAGHREHAGTHRGRDERHDQQVDAGRYERQAAEREQHVGEGRGLGGERDPEALGEPPGEAAAGEPADPSTKRRRPGEEPGRGRDRQAEPRVADHRGLRQEHQRRGEAERRRRASLPARLPRDQDDRGHRGGPDHRRRRSRGDDVRDDRRSHDQRDDPPWPPAEGGRHEPADDRDVPARDRDHVARARGGEVGGELAVHPLPQPHQDPGRQAGLGLREGEPERVAGRVPRHLERDHRRRLEQAEPPRLETAGRAGPPEVLAIAVVFRRRPERARDLDDRPAPDDGIRGEGRRDGDRPWLDQQRDPRDLAAVPRRSDRLDDRPPGSGTLGKHRDGRRSGPEHHAQRQHCHPGPDARDHRPSRPPAWHHPRGGEKRQPGGERHDRR